MRYFLLGALICLSFQAYAADTVRVYDPSNLIVTGRTSPTESFTLGSDDPSGDATSEAAPARVYVPIQSGAGNHLFSTLNVTSLYNTADAADVITYPLVITTGATNPVYLYAAVKYSVIGTSFFPVAKVAVSPSATNANVTFDLSTLDICKAISANGNTACTNLAVGSVTEVAIKPIVYFFISTSNLDITGVSGFDPTSTNTGGVFFETQMSNRIYSSTDLITSITRLSVGDKRLIVEFTSSTTMDSTVFKKVIVANTPADQPGNPNYNTLITVNLGTIFNRDVSTAQQGEFTLNELNNNGDYNLSIAFLDKFLFATTFSNSAYGKPMEIQELLKKNSCFLLTAGFGEEHYVINYFRHYRDHVLAKSWLGQKFIKVYYRSAPHYAGIIYQSESMRFSIRILAYILYFFFNFSWVLLVIYSSCYFLNLRKNKIILPDNGL